MKTSQATGIALVTLLAGGAGGYLLGQQKNAPGNADVAFAQDMMTHHAQAIDMANRLYVRLLAEKTLSPQQQNLKYLSYDIITGQSNQNGQLLGWLSLWGKSPNNPTPMDMQAMGMATSEQVEALSDLPLNEATSRFLQLMIRHHQGGVMMAESALKSARTQVVKTLAQKVVGAQSNEIQQMKNMLTEMKVEPQQDLEQMDMDSMPGMDHSN
ncbi:DUF305 domain-containing protein [Deinococcus roseus]|uniref:DUF305 domain-containing protein n=1 Tax=Deinococcus roseus TaxID=392414 RepID=A0ABQ2CXW1_9DEIO|nr:DUF305 domain-containing protein [Deinococcus roseus]GGJ31835.1 hypothetical protein GCM10008938_17470 [Deinococcus roseus]